jgi:hypothetical protein
MPDSPKSIAERLARITAAWEAHAPNATFAKMTLPEWKTAIKPSADARTTVADLEKKLAAAINVRVDTDKVIMEKADKVVKAMVGDPEYGDDSSLYEAMGYIRDSERKSGLTRKKKTPPAGTEG